MHGTDRQHECGHDGGNRPVTFQRGVSSPTTFDAANGITSSECVLGAKRARLSNRFCCEPQASIAKIST